MISVTLPWQPEIHVCDIVTSQILAGHAKARRARKHREKGGYFSQFDGILAKTRNLIFLEKEETSNLVFLSIACVASVSVEQRAKKEPRTGISAFCPREKWGESQNKERFSRPIFRAGKSLKTRFLALCSTETLATQAILSINQMPRAQRLSSKTTDLGEFNFLKCTILLIPVPI